MLHTGRPHRVAPTGCYMNFRRGGPAWPPAVIGLYYHNVRAIINRPCRSTRDSPSSCLPQKETAGRFLGRWRTETPQESLFAGRRDTTGWRFLSPSLARDFEEVSLTAPSSVGAKYGEWNFLPPPSSNLTRCSYKISPDSEYRRYRSAIEKRRCAPCEKSCPCSC